MNACVLLLGVIDSAGKPARRIGSTIALLVLMGPGFFIYRRHDPEVVNDTAVVRDNRVEAIVFVFGGLTLSVLSVLYQLWFG